MTKKPKDRPASPFHGELEEFLSQIGDDMSPGQIAQLLRAVADILEIVEQVTNIETQPETQDAPQTSLEA